jgi:glycosyltransferase involved in cell wall biosynthesis
MPFFSIVIPTYNRAGLLARAIDSVLKQSFEDFELIVVDDHSVDDTKNVVNLIKDPRVRYLENRRTKGSAGSKNTGIENAEADWIAFLDDDDYWLPEKLEKQHQKIEQTHGRFGLIYTLSSDLKDEVLIRRKGNFSEGWIFWDLLYQDYLNASSVVIRRDVLQTVKGYDENMPANADTDLFVRIAKLYEIGVVREMLVVRDLTSQNRLSGAENKHKKLSAQKYFYNKHRRDLVRRPAWKSRILSSIFANSLIEGEWKSVVRTLPYAFASLVYDPKKRSRLLARRSYQALRRRLAALLK